MSDEGFEMLRCESCGQEAVWPTVLPNAPLKCSLCGFEAPGSKGGRTVHNGAPMLDSGDQ